MWTGLTKHNNFKFSGVCAELVLECDCVDVGILALGIFVDQLAGVLLCCYSDIWTAHLQLLQEPCQAQQQSDLLSTGVDIHNKQTTKHIDKTASVKQLNCALN